ncbi:MAG: LPS-assembly lipoprotein [Parasphingorhabdus sp.]
MWFNSYNLTTSNISGEIMRKLVILALVLAVAMLQGCGFKLRGKVELSPMLSDVYIDASDLDISTDLKKSLRFSGANILSGQSAARSIILVDSRYERVVSALDSRGLATGYVLRYEVRFKVVDSNGEDLYESPIISQRRNFDFNAEQLLEKEGEEDFLKKDMRKELVQQIMRQISAIS